MRIIHKKHIFSRFYPRPYPRGCLANLGNGVNFAEQNVTIMCTMKKSYERFARLIENGETLRDPEVTFKSICRELRVSPSALDEIVERELGVKGQELIDKYRKNE